MKFVRLILLVLLGAFVLYVKLTAPPINSAPVPATVTASKPAVAEAQANSAALAANTPANPAIPQKALDVLQTVRLTGQPPEGYVGGRVFENREGRLAPGGDYREFDVDPHNGQRNAERLIVEWNTKKAWYTGDHYQTFIPMP